MSSVATCVVHEAAMPNSTPWPYKQKYLDEALYTVTVTV